MNATNLQRPEEFDAGPGGRTGLGASYLPTPRETTLTDVFLDLHVAVQVAVVIGVTVLTIAAVLLLIVMVRTLRQAVSRLLANRDKPALDSAGVAKQARERGKRVTHVIGILASTASAAYTLYVFRDVPGDNPIVWAGALMVTLVLELQIINFAVNALANALETGKIGFEGKALFVGAGAIALITWTKQVHPGLKPLAILPIAAGISYFILLRHAVHQYRVGHPQVADEREDIFTILVNRALVLFRLADRKGISVSEQDRRTRIKRLVRNHWLSRHSTVALRRKLARALYNHNLLALQERYGVEVYVEAKRNVAALEQAYDEMERAAKADATIWTVVDPLAGVTTTPAVTASTPMPAITSSPAATTTSTAEGTTTSTATTVSTAATTTTIRPAATWAEVTQIRQTWSSADLHARRADIEVAHAHAVNVAQLDLDRTGVKTEALRTYCLAMYAAGHSTWNQMRMYREVTGDTGRSAQGGQVYRRIAKELEQDATAAQLAVEDLLSEVEAGGSGA